MTDISHLIGCSKSHAVSYKATLNAEECLKSLINSNRIKNLEKAALLANVKDLTIRDSAIQRCLDGATLKELKSITKKKIEKSSVSFPIEKRGRQSSTINFGKTKNYDVAKLILKSVIDNKQAFQDHPINSRYRLELSSISHPGF